MKSVNQWLSEYGQSHQNKTNKMIHWICVPLIFWSITGLLYCIKIPLVYNAAMIALFLVMLYYFRMSFTLGVGMLFFALLCLGICHFIVKYVVWPLWLVCLVVFVLAWIGQFYGHGVEGKKPSFFKDLQFLLIGPMWLMSFVYKKLHISY